MKNEWSKSWNASIQPRKQRKYAANLPLHRRGALVKAHLSKELRARYNSRSVQLKKGDIVKIMRGSYSGKTGAVERIDLKRSVVFITGIEIPKRDGSKAMPPLQPSNLMITEIKTDDKKRMSAIARSMQNAKD
ncbi:MAG TPA: 50S ribosomal protein L24 [Candidatus Nanoarchaeia archaeon]|nr:50S ribosomal protein L24 [Candidatus Nanoarchaeia archaeon]